MYQPAIDYLTDAAQRTVLFCDVMRERGIAAGLVTAAEIDALAGPLQAAAAAGGYDWATSPFFLDVTMRKPA